MLLKTKENGECYRRRKKNRIDIQRQRKTVRSKREIEACTGRSGGEGEKSEEVMRALLSHISNHFLSPHSFLSSDPPRYDPKKALSDLALYPVYSS